MESFKQDKLIEETDKYKVFFTPHLYNRKERHIFDYTNEYISDKKLLNLFHKGYNKIIDKYISNKLSYSKDGKEGFVLQDKYSGLIIVGFIYELEKSSGKYIIKLNTAMYNKNFIPKNSGEYKTVKLIIEQLNTYEIIEI